VVLAEYHLEPVPAVSVVFLEIRAAQGLHQVLAHSSPLMAAEGVRLVAAEPAAPAAYRAPDRQPPSPRKAAELVEMEIGRKHIPQSMELHQPLPALAADRADDKSTAEPWASPAILSV
jgi:hypothetical protein